MTALIALFRGMLLCLLLLFSSVSWSQKITMVTTQWEPFFSENLAAGGVITEIAQAAFAREGHQASIEWFPWSRALKISKEGKADVLMGAYYSAQRAEDYYYSEPIFDIDVGLIARKELNIEKYQSLESLESYTIGVMRGAFYGSKFDSATNLDKIVVTNQATAARMLLARRVDLVAASIPVFEYELKALRKFGTQNGFIKADQPPVTTVVLKPLLSTEKLHLLFNRVNPNSPKMLEDFNRGLAKIRANGTFAKILAKHGF